MDGVLTTSVAEYFYENPLFLLWFLLDKSKGYFDTFAEFIQRLPYLSATHWVTAKRWYDIVKQIHFKIVCVQLTPLLRCFAILIYAI